MTTTAECPGKYEVALDGTGFMLDWKGEDAPLQHQSLRVQKEQAASAENIGESTVNPEGFWRRSRDEWHAGAGQTYSDRDESNPARFFESEGVDVFGTKHQVTLLRAADTALDSVGGYPKMRVVNDRMYAASTVTAGTLQYTSAPTTIPWTTTAVTGHPGNIDGIAALNGSIYVASNGNLYSGSGSTVSAFTTGGSLDGVGVAKGRLFGWDGGALYNITASGALPAALFTANGTIIGVTGQKSWVYFAVRSYGTSDLIYRTTIKADGTALDAPIVAAELPADEGFSRATACEPLYGYAGFLFVATLYGVRMASIDESGDLTLGASIPASAVSVFTGHKQFVYASCESVADMGVTDLMRMDLSTLIAPNTPAYASDMYSGETLGGFPPTGLATYDGRVFFGKQGSLGKIFVESATDYVESGYIESGLLALDLADPKTPVSVDVEGAYPDDSSITEAISVDRGATFTTVGTVDADDDAELAITGVEPARQFVLRTTLTASTDLSETPVLYRHTLKAEPGVNQGDYIIARLRCWENEIGFGGQRQSRTSPADARSAISALQQSRAVVVFQEGSTNWNVTVRDMTWEAESTTAAPRDGDWNGTVTVRMKVVSAA